VITTKDNTTPQLLVLVFASFLLGKTDLHKWQHDYFNLIIYRVLCKLFFVIYLND